MNVLVYASAGEEPILKVWALDSGRDLADTMAGQAMGADRLRTYDWIRPTQIRWYDRTSRELESRHGREIPGLMFFYIPLSEVKLMWDHRGHHAMTGEKNEDVAAGVFKSGLFGAVMDRGDVVGISVGHDHVNDFVGDYFGVRSGYAANTGFGTYGLQ